MTRKTLNVLGGILILVTIMAVVVPLASVYYTSEMANKDIIAKTFVKKVVRSYNPENLSSFRRHLTPRFNAQLNSEKGKNFLKFLSKLGKVKKIEASQWVGSKSMYYISKGGSSISMYKVLARFEHGSGVITLSVVENEGSPIVANFEIASDDLIKLNIEG